MAVDIASIGLEIDSGGMLSGVERIDAALKRLEQAIDRTAAATTRGSRANREGASSISQQAKEAIQLATAQARVQRSMADYTGAIETLRGAMKNVSATSVEYLRIQNQIIQIQNQARRASTGANFEGFAKSLQGIQSQLGGFGGSFGNVVGRIQNATSAIGEFSGLSSTAIGVMGGVAAGLAAVALAAGAVGKSLIDAALEGGKVADSLSDLSQITGINVASLERLEVGYTLFGGNVEQARQALTKFSANVGQAASGEVPQLANALKALGVDPVNAARDLDGALRQTLQALSQTQNQAAAAAVATRLFGREGARLVAVYREMSDENSQLNQEIKSFGLTVGGTALTNAARIGDQLDKMEVQFRAVKLVIADQLAPSLVDLGQSFAGLVAAALPAIKTVAGAFDGLIDKVSFLLNLLSRSPAAFGKLPTGLPGNLIPGAVNRFGQQIIEGPANKATSFVETTDPLANIRKLQESFKQPQLVQKGLNSNDPVVQALRDLAGDKAGTRGGGRGGRSAQDSIKDTTQLLIHFAEVTDRLGRQSIPQVVDTFIDAQRDIEFLSAKFKILSDAGNKTAQVTLELAKAQITLAQAEKKFLDNLSSPELTEQLRKVPLALQQGAPGGLTTGGIPGVGGTILDTARFLRDAVKREFFGIGVGQTFSGAIPGQANGEAGAPDPRSFQLSGLKQQFFGRSTGIGERVQGVGELIAQDFITGALLGKADAKRAGEQIAFFFADYFAKKMTEALSKAFDTLGGIIGGFLQRIIGGIGGGGGGGLLGGIAGTLAGALFGGLGLPIKLGPNSASSLLKSLPLTRFAGGGYASAGSLSIVGENGPELFLPRSGGWIVNQQQAAAGGGAMNVTMQFNISAPNGQVDRRSIDQVSENALFALSRARRNRGA